MYKRQYPNGYNGSPSNPSKSIRGVISNLSFIKNVNYWGLYFQGGIVPINENDFKILLDLNKEKHI